MREIYLDNSATTKPLKQVADSMQETLLSSYGNPSSLHTRGFESEKLLKDSRRIIANSLGKKENTITFNSGGTEGDNNVLQSVARDRRRAGKTIITTAVEHPAILETCKFLESEGFNIVSISVDEYCNPNLDELKSNLSDEVILISAMTVNNEVGTIFPINEINEIKGNALFHTDAVQAYGKMDLSGFQGDFLTASGHKIHGPKGIGFLYRKDGTRLSPLIFGGNQESGYRSGTENMPGIVGMAKAAEIMLSNINENYDRVKSLWQRLKQGILEIGDVARIKIAPKNFGRVAAQTARNIVIQKIRDAQRDSVYGEYVDRENEMITGTIQREDKFNVYVNLDKIEGVVPVKEQVAGEKYIANERMKFLIKDVRSSSKEPQIILSRASENLVTRLFELEVPEITDGIIEIYSIAREAGSRTKIAVFSNDDGIDAVGACIGYKGIRVNSIVEELQNEKIDIINYDKDIKKFISNALSPADIVEVLVNENKKQSLVVVNEYQLSLAIGKEGQNARLAARLTGWKIDIKSKEDFDKMSKDEIDQLLGLVENSDSKDKEEILSEDEFKVANTDESILDNEEVNEDHDLEELE